MAGLCHGDPNVKVSRHRTGINSRSKGFISIQSSGQIRFQVQAGFVNGQAGRQILTDSYRQEIQKLIGRRLNPNRQGSKPGRTETIVSL